MKKWITSSGQEVEQYVERCFKIFLKILLIIILSTPLNWENSDLFLISLKLILSKLFYNLILKIMSGKY